MAAELRVWVLGLCPRGAYGGGCSIASGWEAWHRKADVTPDSLTLRQGWGWLVAHLHGHSHLYDSQASLPSHSHLLSTLGHLLEAGLGLRRKGKSVRLEPGASDCGRETQAASRLGGQTGIPKAEGW